jgi:hypothetical protein
MPGVKEPLSSRLAAVIGKESRYRCEILIPLREDFHVAERAMSDAGVRLRQRLENAKLKGTENIVKRTPQESLRRRREPNG